MSNTNCTTILVMHSYGSGLALKMQNCKELRYKQQRLTFCKIQVLELMAKGMLEAYLLQANCTKASWTLFNGLPELLVI
jgi:hypothetical protein